MKYRFTLLDAATAVAAVGVAALALWIAANGPTGPVPVHFGLDGRPDRYGDRNEVAVLLLFLAGLTAVVGGAMGWHAARSDDPSRRRGLRSGQLVTVVSLVGVAVFSAWTTLAGAGGEALSAAWPMAGVGLLLAAVGAVLGRVGPNPVVGVRTPWSYKSRLAWDRSNRLAGRLFFWIGLAGVLAAPLTPQPAGTIGLVGAILIAAVWSATESWRVWRADPDRQPF